MHARIFLRLGEKEFMVGGESLWIGGSIVMVLMPMLGYWGGCGSASEVTLTGDVRQEPHQEDALLLVDQTAEGGDAWLDAGGEDGGRDEESSAEHGNWIRTYRTAHERDPIVHPVSSGGYIVSVDSPTDLIWILRLDEGGHVVWEKEIGDSYVAGDIAEAGDSGFVAVGSSDRYPDENRSDVLVFKLDHEGRLEWHKIYGSPSVEWGRKIVPARNGSFAAVSNLYNEDGSLNDIWIICVDGDGGLLWQRAYGSDGTDHVNDMAGTLDGGFIVAGGSTSWTGINSTAEDMWIFKLDGEGNIEWQKVIGDRDFRHEMAWSARQTPDGGYIVSGDIMDFNGKDILAVKLDAEGNIVWRRTYGDLESIEWAPYVEVTGDGGSVVSVMRSETYDDWADFLILRLDEGGTVMWQKTFDVELHPGGQTVKIGLTPDGGFITGGKDRSGMMIIKMDGNGRVSDGCPLSMGADYAAVTGEYYGSAMDSDSDALETDAGPAEGNVLTTETAAVVETLCGR
jgi:hypothetical protein